MVIGADDPESLNPPEPKEVIKEAAFDADLLAHMVRCWDAERENAERLNKKVATLVSAIALLFGLGLFKIEWTVDTRHFSRFFWYWAVIIVKLALSGALACFGMGLHRGIRGIRSKRGNRPTRFASELLAFPEQFVASPPATARESRAEAFYRLSAATDELRAQNSEKAARIATCEFWFAWGSALVLIAVLTYIWFSVPPM